MKTSRAKKKPRKNPSVTGGTNRPAPFEVVIALGPKFDPDRHSVFDKRGALWISPPTGPAFSSEALSKLKGVGAQFVKYRGKEMAVVAAKGDYLGRTWEEWEDHFEGMAWEWITGCREWYALQPIARDANGTTLTDDCEQDDMTVDLLIEQIRNASRGQLREYAEWYVSHTRRIFCEV